MNVFEKIREYRNNSKSIRELNKKKSVLKAHQEMIEILAYRIGSMEQNATKPDSAYLLIKEEILDIHNTLSILARDIRANYLQSFNTVEEYKLKHFNEGQLLDNILKVKTSLEEETINLFCCVNDKLVNPMINLMYSIRQYNSDRINLYVLSTSLSEETQERIHKMGDKINIKTNIKLCELPDLYIGEAYWSLDMYLRVLAFEYLPKELDKILYLDADVQAFDDIAPIYEMDISNHVLSARKEPWRESFDKMMNSIKDNNFDHEYFSSGLMLFNLKKMRELWSKEKVFETIKSLKLYFPDQDTLNKLCSKDEILDMPDRYNFYDLWLMVKYQDILKKAPIILHYVSGGKPWNAENPNYEQSFFFKSAKLSGIQEYIDKGKKFGFI